MHQIIETIGYVLNTVPYTAPFAFLGTFLGAPAALPRFSSGGIADWFREIVLAHVFAFYFLFIAWFDITPVLYGG